MHRLRDAIPADLATLADLARTTFVSTYAHLFQPGDMEAHVETHLSDDRVAEWLLHDRVLVAVGDDGEVAAFARVTPAHPADFESRPRPGDKALQQLYVAPGARGMGVGALLLTRVLASVPEDADLYLDVWEDNEPALRLYKRHGFKRLGRKPFRTKSGAGAGYDLVMVRRGERS